MGLLRTVMWRNVLYPGAEYCRLFQTATEFELRGHVVVALDKAPLYAHYVVTCDARWVTRAATVELSQGGASRRLQISADDERRWWVGGDEVEAVRGCHDIDLGITPSTNTLPIQRLDLAVGQGQDVTAAWVSFPELVVQPLPQRYTRLGETSYRYESRDGSFSAQLEVDEIGLVVSYAGVWQREAAGG